MTIIIILTIFKNKRQKGNSLTELTVLASQGFQKSEVFIQTSKRNLLRTPPINYLFIIPFLK